MGTATDKSDPFGGAGLFNNLKQTASTQQSAENKPTGGMGAGFGGEGQPAEMKEMMSMFENLAKHLEGMEDDEDEDDMTDE
jgi:hypothetical protein